MPPIGARVCGPFEKAGTGHVVRNKFSCTDREELLSMAIMGLKLRSHVSPRDYV